jgi:hypothetical protein
MQIGGEIRHGDTRLLGHVVFTQESFLRMERSPQDLQTR